ncbi:hypothetical protein [Winogradskyella sp. UBA3174]|uniref:hypothetical protein n=1 Tax=Winogradskyella sp. UBA3174 TaxID=1947785 RepID=UPI0025FAAB21|nr:hypothetical protein [Winogradskyella sp. UBA3174]|tara:strand:- start:134702 stop:135088 length:387 start_codon:yes stop_codon:yes gene_type:complete
MSAFFDDFYYDNIDRHGKIEAMLYRRPEIEEEYDHFLVLFTDLTASINNHLYLQTIDESIPISEINVMIERMNHLNDLKLSKYAVYRACEDYLVKTEWFFGLTNQKKFKIRLDFYSNIVLGIHQAFYR